MKISQSKRILFRVLLVYVIVVSVWIVVSDYLIAIFISDHLLASRIQSCKGLLTILLTTGLLYKVLSYYVDKLQKSEEALHENWKQLRTLINNLPDAVYFKDSEGRWLEANPNALRTFQIQSDYKTKGYAELAAASNMYSSLSERCRESDQRAWQSGNVLQLEESITQPDGSKRIYEVVKAPLYNPDNSPKGMVVIGRDVTERKRTEAKLRATKEKLKSFIQSSTDVIVVVDLDFITIQVNPAFEKVFGWTADEVIGRKLPNVPEDQMGDFEELHHIVLHGGEVNGSEQVAVCKDGTRIDVSVTISPIHDEHGRHVGYAGIARDITERKRAEAALRESEAKYRIIAENMTDLISIVDSSYVVQYASPSHTILLGGEISEYEGCNVFDKMHPEDVAEAKNKLTELVRDFKLGIRMDSVQVRYRKKNGHYLIFEVKGMPVYDDQGQVEQIVLIGRDITQRLQTEEFLRKSEKLSVVGQLAAGVAHEIRNPLTALKGFVQLLQSNNDRFQSYYAVMMSELDRINTIVSEFLFLAKPQVTHFEKKDIRALIFDILALLETHAIMNNVRIITDFEESIPEINCAENQLKQVFINVLKNAIEAMPAGGEVRIQLRTDSNGTVRIRFEDNGMGIPNDRLQQLGEPFYTTKEKGTGLGLMVSFKIIEAHKGNIKITSEINKGTTVDVVLPI